MEIQVGGYSALCGLVVLGDALITIQEKDNKFKVFGAHNGRHIRSVPVPGLGDPVGIVCTSTDTNILVIISDFGWSRLHFVTLNQKWEVVTHRTKQLNYTPELVVADSRNKKIQIYSQDGDEKRVVQLQADNFSWPFFALKVDQGFVISDNKEHQVIWVDEQGAVMKKYRGEGHEKLDNPYNLALDPVTGHVLVTVWGSYSVQEVDSDAQWVRTVLDDKDGIQWPSTIYLSDSGKLYVGCVVQDQVVVKVVKYYEPLHTKA